jgi:hypothetical protein
MLITVKDACTLQENALDVRVSDQIEQLDELITAEGNGAAFFARTHITAGMRVTASWPASAPMPPASKARSNWGARR